MRLEALGTLLRHVRWSLAASRKGSFMPTSAEHLQSDVPIWKAPELWASAASSNTLRKKENLALSVVDGDPRISVNFHDLRLGPQRLLHGHGEYAFDQIRDLFDFGSWDAWDHQRQWVINLFRAFYGEHEDAIGTFSILAVRRPAAFRVQQDPTIVIAQSTGRIHFTRQPRLRRNHSIRIGDIRVSTEGLRFAGADNPTLRSGHMAMTVVPRQVRSSQFNFMARFEEFWWCLADPVDHRELLQQGRLPAWGERIYEGQAGRIRTSPLLNLVRISRDLTYTLLTIELDPASAEVMSIRWVRSPLAVAMLQASPVEHHAVKSALGKKPDG